MSTKNVAKMASNSCRILAYEHHLILCMRSICNTGTLSVWRFKHQKKKKKAWNGRKLKWLFSFISSPTILREKQTIPLSNDQRRDDCSEYRFNRHEKTANLYLAFFHTIWPLIQMGSLQKNNWQPCSRQHTAGRYN